MFSSTKVTADAPAKSLLNTGIVSPLETGILKANNLPPPFVFSATKIRSPSSSKTASTGFPKVEFGPSIRTCSSVSINKSPSIALKNSLT